MCRCVNGGCHVQTAGHGRPLAGRRAASAQTPAQPKGGHPRVEDRVCLTGILFVLKTGLPWEDFPHEMGCCGMTLWKRLDEWRQAGVWDNLHQTLLSMLRAEDQIDFSRVVVDSSSIRAVHGGKKRERIPWTV